MWNPYFLGLGFGSDMKVGIETGLRKHNVKKEELGNEGGRRKIKIGSGNYGPE